MDDINRILNPLRGISKISLSGNPPFVAIISWKKERGFTRNNCITLYSQLKKLIKQKENSYLRKYGIIPEFRAGIHYGKVVIGELGTSKKEITFIGDILNATSRIVDMCREKETDLLLTDDVLKKLTIDHSRIISYGSFKLRGKQEELPLYSLTF